MTKQQEKNNQMLMVTYNHALLEQQCSCIPHKSVFQALLDHPCQLHIPK